MVRATVKPRLAGRFYAGQVTRWPPRRTPESLLEDRAEQREGTASAGW